MVGVDKVHTQNKNDKALYDDKDLHEMIVHLGLSNVLSYKDLIHSVNTSSAMIKVAFDMVRNAKSLEYPRESSK